MWSKIEEGSLANLNNDNVKVFKPFTSAPHDYKIKKAGDFSIATLSTILKGSSNFTAIDIECSLKNKTSF